MKNYNLARTRQERIRELDRLLYDLSDDIVEYERETSDWDALSDNNLRNLLNVTVISLLEARDYNDELRILTRTTENHPAYEVYALYSQCMLRKIGEILGEL